MFQALLRKLGWDEASRERQKALSAAIEQLVDATDRRLRLVPGYRQALESGMRTAQAYLATLMHQLPPMLDLSLRAYATDPRLGLLFSGPASLLELLENSEPLREFFLSASNGDEAWALMTMMRSETARFGMAMSNGEVRSDVAQIVVSFDAHRLMMLSPSLEQLQAKSGPRGQEVLAAVIARRLSLCEQMRQQLESELGRLQLRRLSLRGGEQRTVIDAQADDRDLPASLSAVDARIGEIQPQLEALRASASLEGMLAEVKGVLEQPQDYFSLESVSLHLNRMGVKCDDPAAGDEDVTELRLEEMVLGKIQPIRRALLPVRVSRQAIDELRQRFGA